VTERDKRRAKMTFAATARCPCGAGLAYDDTCISEPFKIPSYWDCSAILLGEAIPAGEEGSVQHTAALPFTFYEIKSEDQPSARGATTRPQDNGSGSETR
jgi:hypothetical protein